MKTCKYIFFLSIIYITSCSKSNIEIEPSLETTTLQVIIEEMINYPETQKFDLEIRLKGNSNIGKTVTAYRINDSLFSAQITDMPEGTYLIDHLDCSFTDHELMEKFNSIAYYLPEETKTMQIERYDKVTQEILEAKLWSVSYFDELTQRNSSEDEVSTSHSIMLFVNRCNPNESPDKYHEVLRYQLKFKNPSTIGLEEEIIYYNYCNQNIPLLVIDMGSEIKTQTEPIGVIITPYDDKDGDGLWTRSGEIEYHIDISETQWNGNIKGEIDFVHLQIGCSV